MIYKKKQVIKDLDFQNFGFLNKIIVCLAFIMFISTACIAQTVEEIVAKHLTAMGGIEKLRQTKTLVMESEIRVGEIKGFGTRKVYILVARAIKIIDNCPLGTSLEYVEAYDGQKAWFINPVDSGGDYATGQMTIMKDDRSKTIIDKTDPFPLLDYADKGSFIELIGTENINGKDAFHISLVTNTSSINKHDLWLDTVDFLIIKTKNIQKTDFGDVVKEWFYSDYREAEGIKIPFVTSEPASVMSLTLIIKTVKINTEIDENFF